MREEEENASPLIHIRLEHRAVNPLLPLSYKWAVTHSSALGALLTGEKDQIVVCSWLCPDRGRLTTVSLHVSVYHYSCTLTHTHTCLTWSCHADPAVYP